MSECCGDEQSPKTHRVASGLLSVPIFRIDDHEYTRQMRLKSQEQPPPLAPPRGQGCPQQVRLPPPQGQPNAPAGSGKSPQ